MFDPQLSFSARKALFCLSKDLQHPPLDLHYFKAPRSPTSILRPISLLDNKPNTKSLINFHKLKVNCPPFDCILTGKMSGCPAYLGVTINNRLDLEELFRYDFLILCPSEFNATFSVPNWGQEPDKTFDIHLQDSRKSYDIYLTHLLFEQQRIERAPEPLVLPQAPVTSTTLFAIVSGITTVVLMILFIMFVYVEATKAKLVYDSHEKIQNVYLAPACTEDEPAHHGCFSSSHLSQTQIVFIGIYVFLRLAYSFVFTFTVFFAVLNIYIRDDFDQLGQLGDFQQLKVNHTHVVSQGVDKYSESELMRQAQSVTRMQGACSHYISDLFGSMSLQMDNVTANQHSLDMYGDQSSISFLMHHRAEEIFKMYSAGITNFTAGYESHMESSIDPFLQRYLRYLKTIYENEWFSFPLKIFNESDFLGARTLLQKDKLLTGPVVDFGTFLEVEEVEEAQFWPIQFWER